MKGLDIEINVEKIKYMLLSRYHNASQNSGIKIEIANRSIENVSQLKHVGTTVIN
jgi:hypothetical protein